MVVHAPLRIWLVSPQLQIDVHHGLVVDAIEVNGRRFGTQDGPQNKENVDIQHGERIQQMRYGTVNGWTGQP